LALWNAIGTTYGGSGQAAFQVPDLRGRVMVDVGTHADVSTMGNSDGVAVASRRPKHSHTVTDPGHTHSHNALTSGSDARIRDSGGGIGGDATINTATTGITVGVSGTASVDAPAYLVLKAFIVL
jgi:microcystin-dependent protein